MDKQKTYLGNGVYVEILVDALVLTHHDGDGPVATAGAVIILEREAYKELMRFAKREFVSLIEKDKG